MYPPPSTTSQIHRDAHSADEAGLPEDELDIGGFLQTLLAPAAEAPDDHALALEDAAHVDLDGAGFHAVVRPAPRQIRDAPARHHRFGGRAADVDAGAADVLALDHRDLPAGASKCDGERLAGLAGADDDCVVDGVAHAASRENR
jgi:hypothetical protein